MQSLSVIRKWAAKSSGMSSGLGCSLNQSFHYYAQLGFALLRNINSHCIPLGFAQQIINKIINSANSSGITLRERTHNTSSL